MVMEPRRPLISKEKASTEMRLGIAEAVVNEIVPLDGRGNEIGPTSDFACASGEQDKTYDTLSIATDYVSCDKPVMVKSIQVEFKRPAGTDFGSEHHTTPLDQYKLRGYVNDFAGMLDAKWVPKIEAEYQDIEKKTNAQVFVETVPSLGGRTRESFSLALANGWGIGHKDENRGVMILLARNAHRIRIEVRTGLESLLTNEKAAAIVHQLEPKLRDGKPGDRVCPWQLSAFPTSFEQLSSSVLRTRRIAERASESRSSLSEAGF